MNTDMRFAAVAIAICSWLAISNHCAVAALATRGAGFQPASDHRQDADATNCPFHSKPAKQEKPATGVKCCKILRAVVPVVTKSWMRDHANFSGADLSLQARACVAHSRTALSPRSLDTGPPDAHSFAELILQRSLLAHAPPSLA